MSIDNIETNYTNLIRPLITRSVISSAFLENGTLSSGSTVNCSGIFGAGDLIANIQCIDNTTDIIISAKGDDPEKNGVIASIPHGLLGDGGRILFRVDTFGLMAISNNLVSVGNKVITDDIVESRVYNPAGQLYFSNGTSLFTCATNDDTYTYIAGGKSRSAG